MKRLVGLCISMILVMVSTATAGQKLVAAQGVFVPTVSAHWPGRILVNHDEWALSDIGFDESPASARQFALNVANWVTGGRPGRLLVYSENFGLTGSRLAAVMRSAGHSWVVRRDIEFNVSTLQQFDAVFLAGDPADNSVLIDYVRGGGSVYLAGGTAWLADPATEANRWNAFLQAFGLSLEMTDSWTGFWRVLVSPASSGSPIFAGVDGLYTVDGSPVAVLDTSNPDTALLLALNGEGLFASYSGRGLSVPVDIRPAVCPNVLNVRSESVLQVAVLGTSEFDVRKIDPGSIRLLSAIPTGYGFADVATPSVPWMGRTGAEDCSVEGPDRVIDLILRFKSASVLTAIEAALGRKVADGEVVALTLIGQLRPEFGGVQIVGEDLVIVKQSVR